MPLEIYKASAGSGKTFLIVREYLKIVFRRPGAYKNILAVTFTNKATAEMKDRILNDLWKLSSGKPSAHLDYLKDEFGRSENDIRQEAKNILKLILHDYSRFSISTIDSLFQRLIRAFPREMRLNPSYRAEIDSRQVLEEAVERLFTEIDDNETLRRWMIDYAEGNLEEGRRWNMTGELVARGSELFREEFKLFSGPLLEKLADKNYLSSYIQKLREIVDRYEGSLKETGKKGLALMSQYNLTPDQFKYGKTSFANHFRKLAQGDFAPPGKRTLEACDNPDAWSGNNADDDLKRRISDVYDAGLNDLLVSSVNLMNWEGVTSRSASLILSNLFSFGLLTDIALKVSEISKEKNIVLLNDSAHLLYSVISGNDSPFVYEKLGSVYRNFMLDEFQDTSVMQWHNLKPLIENSLAEGHKSIVVGDVKQSIYRWRNSDWNLLASGIENDLTRFGASVLSMTTNWRSSKRIIDFNNILFRESSGLLNEDFNDALDSSGNTLPSLDGMRGVIEKVYADHYQEPSEKAFAGGYVRIQFLEPESNRKRGEFRQMAVEELITQIEALQDKGVQAGEMAVLVRDKKDGALVAKALLERKYSQKDTHYCYDVLSNDSLIIGQSPVVQFILNFFHLFVNPKNDIVKADLVYSYYNYLAPDIEGYIRPDHVEDLHTLFNIHDQVPDLFKPWFGEGESGKIGEGLLSLPLFNLVAKIVNSFGIDKIESQLVYLGAFLDLILKYSRNESGDIHGFLDWWEISGKEETINLPEDRDSITILTIHKAKGLEFHTVFVPFCDWEVTPVGNKAPYLWCHPEQEPFNLLDLVLVRYGRDLQNSIFSEAYFKEMLYSMVDNLNLLYVAFTRAVNSLIVFCPLSGELKKPYRTVSSIIQHGAENPSPLDSIDREKYIDLQSCWKSEIKVFEYGAPEFPLKESEETGHHGRDAINRVSTFRLNGGSERLKLRIHSEGYFDLNESDKFARVGYGRLLHELFENISAGPDVERALKKIVSEGKMDSKTAEEYKDIIDRLLNAAPFNDWFGGSWRVLNERDILRGDENRHRPDRIMMKENAVVILDYKTGEKSDLHHSQVKGYLNDMAQMGYANVKGYLWYLNDNELVEVE